MKKTILMLFVFIILYMLIGNIFAHDVIIPEEAIRLRVIANSNTEHDQEIKLKVKEQVENKLFNVLKNKKTIEEVRNSIIANVDNISKEINPILSKEQYTYNIDYGYNYFPQKTFKGITYDEGYYESLVITLGSGEGNNWWCVLYPPICMIDSQNSADVEYTSLVKELINKYF